MKDGKNFLELKGSKLDAHAEGKSCYLKRSEKFPKKFPKPRFGKIYRNRAIDLDDRTHPFLERGASQVFTIYDCDEKFQFLNQGDVIGVEQTKDHDGDQVLIKITNKRQEIAKDLFKSLDDNPMSIREVEEVRVVMSKAIRAIFKACTFPAQARRTFKMNNEIVVRKLFGQNLTY